jgi:hypothetical protein
MMTTCDEETLITAVKALRVKEPTVAQANVLKQLKRRTTGSRILDLDIC